MIGGPPRAAIERGFVGGPGPPLPVISVRAPAPGPVVAVGANLHGDECTGIGAAFRLADELPALLDRGTVHLYPSLNPKGLEDGTRRMPGDKLDPNRAFPGSLRGSLAERHAWRVWSDLLARRPALYVDLHTDTCGAIPYAIVDRVLRDEPGDRLAEKIVALAEASGLTVLREYPVDRYRRFELDRSLPGALINGPGVAALTLEVGPRRRLDPDAVDLAVTGVYGVLSALWMVRRSATPHPSRRADRVWRRESGPRTTRAGVLVPRVGPGGSFTRGAPLAELRGLSGELREVLVSPWEGFVVALPEKALVQAGVSCATLAVPEEAPGY